MWRTTVCVLPQLVISEHFTVNLHKSMIGALSFNFARHRQLRQHAVRHRHSIQELHSQVRQTYASTFAVPQ